MTDRGRSVTVEQMRRGRGWKRIQRLAERVPTDDSSKRYQLYVIEVESDDPDCEYAFYVGSTSQPLEKRLGQHRGGKMMAGRIFKNGKAWPKCIRYDLMKGLPEFHDETAALEAEGTLARMITQHVGNACSDRKDDRAERHELRMQEGLVPGPVAQKKAATPRKAAQTPRIPIKKAPAAKTPAAKAAPVKKVAPASKVSVPRQAAGQ